MREQSTTHTECTDQNNGDHCWDIGANIDDLLDFDDRALGLDSDAQHDIDDIDALTRMVEEIDKPHLSPPPTPSPVNRSSQFAALAALIPVVSVQPVATSQSIATVQPTATVQPAVAAPAALREGRQSLQLPPPASKEQRKLKVQRYLYKRSRRVWTKDVNARRSESTAKRQRTGQGRFVRSTTKWVSC